MKTVLKVFSALAAAAGSQSQTQGQGQDACKDFFHKSTSRFDFLPEKQKSMCLAAHTEFDLKQMLTVLPYDREKQGTVDSYWNPLNPEHGLPRNLVSSSMLSAAPRRSPSHRIP